MKSDEESMALTGMFPCYIRKDYMTRMLIRFSALAVAGTAAFCAAFYYNLDRTTAGGYVSVLNGVHYMRENILRNFILTETGILLFLGTAVILLTLLMSHRIAGPLFRLESTAKAVGAGDLTTVVRLRDKDQLKKLADQVNALIEGLNFKVGGIVDNYRLLERDVLLLASRAASGDCTSDAECAAIIRDILEDTLELKEKLAAVKTE